MWMLRELSIKQFAIIENMRIDFAQGFHVLTGETGAGKSILIDALGLIMGGRSSTVYVRHGAKKAEIEALFEIEETHPVWQELLDWGVTDESDLLIIRREILANGKSTSRVNGRLVTVSMLKKIGQKLLDICGQHEYQSLLHVDEHLEWLDVFAGQDLLTKRQEYEHIYQAYRQVEQELAELTRNEREIAEQMDLYRYQRDEIASSELIEGEDEELANERNRLASMEKLMSHTAMAYNALQAEGMGIDQIGQAMANLENAADMDQELKPLFESIQEAYYQLEEAARQLGFYRDQLEFHPERLHEVEERLQWLDGLKRKYGQTISEILQYQQKIEQKLEQYQSLDETLATLTQKRDRLKEECKQLASELTKLRKQAAQRLENRVETELRELNMASTVFHVAFFPTYYQEDRLNEKGQDLIEFQIAPNPGEPLRPLNKIASGGELSRMMLALKCIFTDQKHHQTVIFDEIDTGVSGRTAQAIAERIAILSKNNQVLCVTHLPQVACMADRHYCIFKDAQQQHTKAYIDHLDHHRRTLELARMLGGVEVTETTRKHAEEMLRLAHQVKHG